jgi:hypothetical protein
MVDDPAYGIPISWQPPEVDHTVKTVLHVLLIVAPDHE